MFACNIKSNELDKKAVDAQRDSNFIRRASVPTELYVLNLSILKYYVEEPEEA